MAKKPKQQQLKIKEILDSGALGTVSNHLAVAPNKPPALNYLLSKTEQPPGRRSRNPEYSSMLAKSIINTLNGGDSGSVESLAFDRDPRQTFEYAWLYRPKLRGIPDSLLKRIAIQDDLVAAIVHARSSMVSQFGRVPEDRHTLGFKLEPDESRVEKYSDEQKQELQKRIDAAQKVLLHCGAQGVDQQDKCSFSEYLYQSVRNGVVVGRFATEIRSIRDPRSNERRFHSFRPIDAGTIYYASAYENEGDRIREQAKQLLERLRNKKVHTTDKDEDERYAWFQVIEGKPLQAFTADELLVHSLYPVTDWEWGGYPLTPLDTVLSAVTTHINITSHNKAYFQSGRASRGMLVLKSNDINQQIVEALRQQFNASINGVQNAWRMPVFGVTPEDDIVWQPIDQGGRDMEFQYLSDTNARVILSAFQMSPEELPGYQHLSRGTNSQALSETNSEYKLEAARDVGIRPLLASIEDFINADILPLVDKNLANIVKFKFVGLDADTPEKETVGLIQAAPVHGTMNWILKKVEKELIPKEYGGEFPLNQQFQAIIEKYLTFGEILEQFFGRRGASQDPKNQFYQNPVWMQFQQMQMQQAQQQQMAEQQQQQQQQQGQGELENGVDQLMGMMKSEAGLSSSQRKLKAQHEEAVKRMLDEWEKESRAMIGEVVGLADHHAPKKS